MENKAFKRKLVAILSADVKNYTSLMKDDEQATVETLSQYKKIMEGLIVQHHGRVVDSPGDNLLAEFDSVVDAAQGGVAIQRELKTRNAALPGHRKMQFRMGINLGDVIVDNDRLFGDGVNLAARLEGLADPGGICISRTAYDQIEDKLPLGYEYLGEQQVKNVAKPIRAYKVVLWPEEQKGKSRGRKTPFRKTVSPETVSAADESKREAWKARRRERINAHFSYHLKSYLGVITFLGAINMLSWSGVLWFHWPALGWGLALYLHWLRASALKSGK